MTSIKAENRELDALDINQPKESLPRARRPAARGYYLALTFGTLLSSQGADAQKLDPSGLRSWLGVQLYSGFQHHPHRGAGPAALSDRAAHGEPYTTSGGLCRGVPGGRPGPLQATPAGRNWTLTRGPTGFVVFGIQCSQVRWHEPPMTTRSPCPRGKRRLAAPPPAGRSSSGRGEPNDTIATIVSALRPRPMRSPCQATLSRPSRYRHIPALTNRSPNSGP